MLGGVLADECDEADVIGGQAELGQSLGSRICVSA